MADEQNNVLEPITVTPEFTAGSEGGWKPTRLDAIGVSLTQDNLIGTVANVIDDFKDSMRFNYDPDFNIGDYPEAFDGIDSAYWDELRGAKSYDHLQHLNKEYGRYAQSAEYLDSLGIEGQAYRIISVLGDVPLISALQKVRGAGRMAKAIDKMNSSYAGRALIAGTIEGAFEGVKQIASPVERTEVDMLLAIGAGGLIGGIYKPTIINDEMSEVLVDYAQEGINRAGAKAPVNERTRSIIEDLQFNITSRFLKAPSETLNNLGNRMFNNILREDEALGDFKAIEIRDNVKAAIDNAFTLNFDPLYIEYMQKIYGKRSAALMRVGNADQQEEFFTLLGDMFYGRENPLLNRLDDAFKEKAAQAFTNMSEQTFDILQRNGHTKFIDGSITRTAEYAPLRWGKDAIKAAIDEGKFTKQDFQQAVLNGFVKKFDQLGIIIDPKRLEAAAKGFTNTLTKKELTGGGAKYINEDNILKKAIQEVTDYLELTDEQAELVARKMTEQADNTKEGTASSTKHRSPVDLEGSYVTESGFEIRLKDFVDTNIQNNWAQYATTMSGDTALRVLGIESRPQLGALRSQIVKELSGGLDDVTGANKKYLDAFDATMEHLFGISSKKDPDGTAWRSVRTLNNLTRAARLGATWFAMSAEAARVAHRVGVKNLIQTLPQLKQVVNAYKGKEFNDVYRELMLHEALGGELNKMTSIARYDETNRLIKEQGTRTLLDRFERFSDVANEATMLAGGVKSGTAILEYWHSIAARTKMMDMARKGLDDKAYDYFEKYGFDRELADQIAEQINKFGSKDLNEPLLNLDKWENGLGQKWSLGVRRQSYQLVQRSNFGDNAAFVLEGKLIGDTVLGALALSLKNYMIVAYNKQLSKGLVDLSRGGKARMDTLGNWTYQAVFASVGYTAKQYAQYGNDSERLEEALSPERIALNTFSMTTFASLLPPVIDTASELAFDDAIFNTYTRGEPAGFPVSASLEYLKDVTTGVRGVANLISPAADASEHELRKALGSLPLSNAMGIKMLTNEMAEAFAEKSSRSSNPWN